MKKKLYFDFVITNNNRSLYFPCTWPTSSVYGRDYVNSYPVPVDRVVTERHGELLDALPALTGGAPTAVKQRREVSAWFETEYPMPACAIIKMALDFVGQDLTTRTPFLLPGGAQVTSKLGLCTVFTRHFAVRLRSINVPFSWVEPPTTTKHTVVDGGVLTSQAMYPCYGTLYVQRQHSIEV